MASWYKECQEGLREYPDERADLRDLVQKMSNREGAFNSQGSENEVEYLRRSLAAKKGKLFESQWRCTELELVNVQLFNRANDIDRKNRELIKHVEEVNVGFLKLIVDHGKTNKELCQVRTSKEGFWKLCETLEAKLSMSEDARKKLVVNLESLRTWYHRYHRGYLYWKAKIARYFAELSFVPWFQDLLWPRRFHWGFENCWHLVIHRVMPR
jgi:hypothetical protein